MVEAIPQQPVEIIMTEESKNTNEQPENLNHVNSMNMPPHLLAKLQQRSQQVQQNRSPRQSEDRIEDAR